MQIIKIMERSNIKREPYDKKFVTGEAIYYNEKNYPFVLLSKKSFLSLETMDIIYTI